MLRCRRRSGVVARCFARARARWVVDALKQDHEALAAEMEIEKALEHLRQKEFDEAITALKAFERKDPRVRAMAATNLSFIYFLEDDLAAAEKYADIAYQHDRYNAKALVNKGNCLAHKNEGDQAKQFYLEAIGVEADCVEAIYNLGLVNLKMELWSEALQAFEKLHQVRTRVSLSHYHSHVRGPNSDTTVSREQHLKLKHNLNFDLHTGRAQQRGGDLPDRGAARGPGAGRRGSQMVQHFDN